MATLNLYIPLKKHNDLRLKKKQDKVHVGSRYIHIFIQIFTIYTYIYIYIHTCIHNISHNMLYTYTYLKRETETNIVSACSVG